MGDEHGCFPFGRPNTSRPMRRPEGQVSALVIGVYPSAFHIGWTPPPEVDPRPADGRRHRFVSSLAVDVEPTVFWDGQKPTPADELERWRLDVRYDPEQHGEVWLGNNGPTGSFLDDEMLRPLGLDPAEVAFTDAVPWFFVKPGATQQGGAMKQRYNEVAPSLGLPLGTLPPRPSEKTLVALAASDERAPSLRTEILDADARLVITLGNEALGAVSRVAEARGLPEKLSPDAYDRRGSITIDHHEFEVLPLAHPGMQRQTRDLSWREALTAWRQALD